MRVNGATRQTRCLRPRNTQPRTASGLTIKAVTGAAGRNSPFLLIGARWANVRRGQYVRSDISTLTHAERRASRGHSLTDPGILAHLFGPVLLRNAHPRLMEEHNPPPLQYAQCVPMPGVVCQSGADIGKFPCPSLLSRILRVFGPWSYLACGGPHLWVFFLCPLV